MASETNTSLKRPQRYDWFSRQLTYYASMMPPSTRPAPVTTGVHESDDTIKSSSDFPMMEAVQQLLRERKSIEDYARTAYASLSELRERILTEKRTVDAQHSKYAGWESMQAECDQLKLQTQELQPQLEHLRSERNEAVAKVAGLEQEILALRTAHDAGQAQAKCLKVEHEQLQRQIAQAHLHSEFSEAEVAQARRQLDEERQRDAEVKTLLQRVMDHAQQQVHPSNEMEKLKAECGRLAEALHSSQQREQNLRERLAKSGDLAHEKEQLLRERRDLAERLQIVDQIEAELRQQQAAQKERATMEATNKTTQSISVSAIESALMTFCCKNCQKDVQVSARRAGLMSKCPHCNRIVPVPKR